MIPSPAHEGFRGLPLILPSINCNGWAGKDVIVAFIVEARGLRRRPLF